jgi:hypothetical protein
MEDNTEFSQTLQTMLLEKQKWFTEVQLGELFNDYRLLHTCVKNIYDMLIKKTLIDQDPYRLDKRITSIEIPATSAFPDSDNSKALGMRFSDYEVMLDYICTYYKFTLDTLTIPEIRKLLEFNACFDWKSITTNSSKSNSRALAAVLNQARINAPGVIISMINDSVTKSEKAMDAINAKLNELGIFQREAFKGQIRREIIANPDFNRAKAYESADAELAEIKRLYSKIIGKKKTFYSDLINEIIDEDLGSNALRLRENVLKKLAIKGKVVKQEKKKAGVDPRKLLMDTVFSLGGVAPVLMQLNIKLSDNFGHLYSEKKGFFAGIGRLFRQAFKMKKKEHYINLKIVEAKNGSLRNEKIAVSEVLANIAQKTRIYTGIANKGIEYQKIEASSTDAIINFVNHQISECQSLFTIINALDAYFKTEIDVLLRPKMKGLQIDLSSFRNMIIAVNKKRSEFISTKEEIDQMKKLGIADV